MKKLYYYVIYLHGRQGVFTDIPVNAGYAVEILVDEQAIDLETELCLNMIRLNTKISSKNVIQLNSDDIVAMIKAAIAKPNILDVDRVSVKMAAE